MVARRDDLLGVFRGAAQHSRQARAGPPGRTEMNFELSEEQRLLRDSVREFLAAELPLEASRRIMEHEPRGFDGAAWRRFAEMGYLGVQLPEAAGGQGLGTVDAAIVLEEIGRACAPGPHLDVMLAAAMLAAAGGHEGELREIAAGKRLMTI